MQSRRMSLIEAVANILVGYGLAVLTQIVVFPMFGLQVSVSENFLLAALFTGISLIRGYTLRRLFNTLAAKQFAELFEMRHNRRHGEAAILEERQAGGSGSLRVRSSSQGGATSVRFRRR